MRGRERYYDPLNSPFPPSPKGLTVTYCNHVDLSNPVTYDRATAIMDEATRITTVADFPTDTSCCVHWFNGGADGSSTFGQPGDGRWGEGKGLAGDYAELSLSAKAWTASTPATSSTRC